MGSFGTFRYISTLFNSSFYKVNKTFRFIGISQKSIQLIKIKNFLFADKFINPILDNPELFIKTLVQLNHFNRIDYLLSIIPLVGIDFNAGSDPFSLTFAQNFNLNESLVCLCRNLFTVKDESHCRIFHILLSFGIY
jgi:hypothetical protein